MLVTATVVVLTMAPYSGAQGDLASTSAGILADDALPK